jgi:hypothetical protein
MKEFFAEIMSLQAHLIHKARVVEFIKGLASAQAKADEVLSQEEPQFLPAEFTNGAKYLALYDNNTMEKFKAIYEREDLKAIVFGIYDAYDCSINDDEAKKLVVDTEVDAKLMCLRFKKSESEKKLAMESEARRKSSVVVVSQPPSAVIEKNVEEAKKEVESGADAAAADEAVEIWKKKAALMGSVKELEVPNAPGGDDQVEEMPDTDDDGDASNADIANGRDEQPPVVIDADAVSKLPAVEEKPAEQIQEVEEKLVKFFPERALTGKMADCTQQ